MNKIISLFLAIVMLAASFMVGCTPTDDPEESSSSSSNTPDTPKETESESTPDSEIESETESETDAETEPEPEPIKSDFEIYQSNIVYGTGHNYMVYSANAGATETATYRGVFAVQEHGEFDYKFYFSNNMDASSSGFKNYPTLATEAYKIHSAVVMTTSDIKGMQNLSEKTAITFDGSVTRDVAAGEMFWSDVIKIDVAEGEYLVFEWTVEFTRIPATIVANTYYSYKEKSLLGTSLKKYGIESFVPLPDLIGCNREKVRLTFIGDSITMGTGSGSFLDAFWVKQIADRLGTGYSVWNLGLDSGRAHDVINGTSWKEKLKNTDILSICLGINDVANGIFNAPSSGRAASIDEIYNYISSIAKMGEEAGAEIIIFSIPPFNLSGETETKRTTVNKKLKALAEEKGYKFFDFAAVLGMPDKPNLCRYGDHPNKEGCTAVAEAFMAAEILKPIE